MVTKTKRLPLTLDPELGSLISEIAELREVKQTKVVTEILEECRPQLIIIRDALKALKNNEKPNTDDILIKLLGSSFKNVSDALESLQK